MSRHGPKNGIPDRWLDYTAVGRRLDGTRFVAFKVPLKQSLSRRLPCSDVFGPWELLDALSAQRQELGLMVDLTFTTRYYSLQDVPESLLCVKIFTAGHEVPGDDTILSFKRAVCNFLRDNKDNDKLIGVHCTHGLNRTGYLICRYLIDVDGMDPDEAVELFNSSRGHAIERRNYLEDLRLGPKRSNEGMEESEQQPQRGRAVRRPPSTPSDGRDERRTHFTESWYHRSFPPPGPNHRSHDRLLPSSPFGPPPPFRPAPLHPYRWTPMSRPEWSPAHRLQEDRRRPLPPPPSFLPRYSPHWSNESGGCDGAEPDRACPRMRHHIRHTNRHRANGYDYPGV